MGDWHRGGGHTSRMRDCATSREGTIMANEELLAESIDVYIHFLKYLDEFVSRPAAEFQISFEQYLILHDVSRQQDLTLMTIAEDRKVTRSAISRQIRSLLNKNLILQSPDPHDRRKMNLSLTQKGQAAEQQITARVTKRFSTWIGEFGEEQAKQVIDFIREFGIKFANAD